MARLKPDDPVVLGPWPGGMNNRQPDYALPAGTVRNAVNADFDAVGFVRRRSGYSKVYAGAGLRSGFSCPAGTFFAEANSLKQLNDDNTAAVVAPIFGDHVAYEYFNGVVYYSDGVVTGKIAGGIAHEWGLQPPPSPQLYGAAGTLQPGVYVAALTYVDALGVEHGASEISTIELVSPGGVTFYNLPPGRIVRLYLSTPNGTTLFAAAQLSDGSSAYTVSSPGYDAAGTLNTSFVTPPPPGRIIRQYNGRMYIADGSTLWYTEPYAPDRIMASKNFFVFSDPITVVEPVDGGLIVVADKTYLYAGPGPEKFEQEIKLHYGAVFGTSCRVPNTDDVMWYSTRGVVMADSSGSVTNRQEANVAAESGTTGAAIAMDSDGVRKFIASVRDPVVSPLVSRSFFDMEIIRKSPA
jgi:hypothetical protein